jgi:hypothetical protein
MIRDALCEYTGPHASFKRNLDVQENVAIRALKSIFNIFQAKWLERMWVVQETALPRQLAFFRGYHAMSGDDLWRSLHLLLKYQHATKIRYPDIRTDRRALKNMILHLLRPPHQGRGIQFFWHTQTDAVPIQGTAFMHFDGFWDSKTLMNCGQITDSAMWKPSEGWFAFPCTWAIGQWTR